VKALGKNAWPWIRKNERAQPERVDANERPHNAQVYHQCVPKGDKKSSARELYYEEKEPGQGPGLRSKDHLAKVRGGKSVSQDKK